MIETQMIVKTQQVSDLESQAEHLMRMEPEKQEEIAEKKRVVDERFNNIMAPLEARKNELLKKKEAFQLRRDIEDESLWIEEKMAAASTRDMGNSLQAVILLQKKNKMMISEIENHEIRINAVVENGQRLIAEDHKQSVEWQQGTDDLQEKWAELKDLLEARKQQLLMSERVQQFLYDATEAESWMSEQELYMMVEDRGKDEFSAQNLMKKHGTLESTVEDYAETIRQLGETARQLISDEHPKKEAIGVKIGQVDKLYAGLKDLATERRAKLDDALKLFR